jgi:hypothetical protein
MPKLSSACFDMKTVTSFMKTETLKLVYFAYFHSIMSYGIIFGEIQQTAKKKVFNNQERIIRIMVATKRRASYRELFKKFNILPLASKFLLSLLLFVVDNMERFKTNSDIHSIHTRYIYISFMFQTLPSVNIKKEFTILELSYSINFHLT